MFGESTIIRPTPKAQSRKPVSKPSGPFAFMRRFTDQFYRDPYKWGLMKCVTFFAASVLVARTLSELDILPVDPPSPPSPQAAY